MEYSTFARYADPERKTQWERSQHKDHSRRRWRVDLVCDIAVFLQVRVQTLITLTEDFDPLRTEPALPDYSRATSVFARKLRELKQQTGCTWTQLHQATGIPVSTLKQYSMDQRKSGTLNVMCRIAAHFGLKLEDMIVDKPLPDP